MPVKSLTILLSGLLTAAYCAAQVPDPLIFSRLTKKDGLVSNSTYQTVRDQRGFLWIATQNGLQRYDGTRLLTFRHIPGDSNSIAKNALNHVYIDSKQRLWLLFDKEAGIFNTSNNRFRSIRIGSPVGMTKKITEDANGNIVLFADNKQLLLDEKAGSFSSSYPLPPMPAPYPVNDMAFDAGTGNYLLTGKQGSLLYDPRTKKFRSTAQHNIASPALDSFCAIKNARYPFAAKDGSLWLVSWQPFTAIPPVLFRYDKNKDQLQRFEKIRA